MSDSRGGELKTLTDTYTPVLLIGRCFLHSGLVEHFRLLSISHAGPDLLYDITTQHNTTIIII
jgi:hypothetical protein